MDACIAKAPLNILPIKTPSHLISKARAHLANGSEIGLASADSQGHYSANLFAAISADEKMKESTKNTLSPTLVPNNTNQIVDILEDASHTLALKDTSITSIGRLSPLPPAQPHSDLQFTSPIFNYTPFDAISLLEDHSDSTDDYLINTDLRGGLTNVNYDFDLSDHSGENSVAEDLKLNLEEFDPLAQKTSAESDLQAADKNGSIVERSLLDSDSPTNGTLLPSPLKPTVTDYRGFSSFEIPSISCNTGDFASLNHSINESENSLGAVSTVIENSKAN